MMCFERSIPRCCRQNGGRSIEDFDDTDLDRYAGVVVAASIHANRYSAALTDFARANAGKLNSRPTLLISLSLTAAGHDADDWIELKYIEAALEDATGWHPTAIEQVAGAYQPSKYDVFTRFVMRRIIAEKDPDANVDADCEYTDWARLDAAVDAWKTANRLEE